MTQVKESLAQLITEQSAQNFRISHSEHSLIQADTLNVKVSEQTIPKTSDALINTDYVYKFDNQNLKQSCPDILFLEPSDIDLKQKIDLYEREINLLKSLILINNLHLNTADNDGTGLTGNKLFKSNHYVSMTNEKSEVISHDKELHQKIQNLNLLTIQITNFGQELKELKTSIQNQKLEFLKDMSEIINKVVNAFNVEVKNRNRITGKIKGIEKLI